MNQINRRQTKDENKEVQSSHRRVATRMVKYQYETFYFDGDYYGQRLSKDAPRKEWRVFCRQCGVVARYDNMGRHCRDVHHSANFMLRAKDKGPNRPFAPTWRLELVNPTPKYFEASDDEEVQNDDDIDQCLAPQNIDDEMKNSDQEFEESCLPKHQENVNGKRKEQTKVLKHMKFKGTSIKIRKKKTLMSPKAIRKAVQLKFWQNISEL